MSKINYYSQCILEKKTPNGVVNTICYIDSKYAVIGKIVGMQRKDDSWDEGWKVLTAGPKTEAKLVEDKAHNYENIWKPSTALTNRGNK